MLLGLVLVRKDAHPIFYCSAYDDDDDDDDMKEYLSRRRQNLEANSMLL